jgi:hypothetical protein
MSECKHEDDKIQNVSFATANDGYYAIYVQAGMEQEKLLNVVGWVTRHCQCGAITTAAYVAPAYNSKLRPASEIEGFVSLIGPNPQSDQKANANRVVSEMQMHRNIWLAQQARKRRAERLTHLSAKKRTRRKRRKAS